MVAWKGAAVSRAIFYSATGVILRVNFWNDASFDIVSSSYFGIMAYPKKKCGIDFVDAFMDGRVTWKIYDYEAEYIPQFLYKRLDGQHSSVTMQFYRKNLKYNSNVTI